MKKTGFIFVLSLFLIPTIPFAQQAPVYQDEMGYRVEIDVATTSVFDLLQELGLAIDHVHFKSDERTMIAELFGFELNKMVEAGISFSVKVEDVSAWYYQRYLNDIATFDINSIPFDVPENFQLGSMGGHKILAEVISDLDLMHDLFPDLITEKFSIGQSIEGREIWAVWMGTGVGETDKPQALYTSLIHAREPNSMMAVVYYMWWLLENYGIDEEATFILDNRHLGIIPVLNPDGYEHNRMTNPNGGGNHRKNRRPVGLWNQGVDLNRNFGPMFFWDHPNGGSSTSPQSDVYRGESPFSEPETTALRDFVESHDFRTAFNYHTYSNLLVYPYGALQRESADSLIFRSYASEMTEFNEYQYGTDIQTVGYNTRGNSDDWMYGMEIGNPNGRKQIIAFTPEVGRGFPQNPNDPPFDGFWPMSSRIIPLSQENVHPNKLLAVYAGPELRFQFDDPPAPSTMHLDVSTTNYISFDFGPIYNYGRSSLKDAYVRVSTDFEGADMVVGQIPVPQIAVNTTLSGFENVFIIEMDPWTERDQVVNVTLELVAPWAKQQPSWEYQFITQGSSLSTGDDGELPSGIRLHQNYPNPFNPNTQIRFSLNRPDQVTLAVYDATGRMVQTLLNQNMNSGIHTVNFDGSGLSSGMYLYRLQAGDQVFIRKMTLVK